ncbi:MAG TPA: nuclear transport factor 2 family protein [Candidatus Binatia bacterium]|nr:nuclear transport factor 2 family protein [Candidatus Binatia bacterium]
MRRANLAFYRAFESLDVKKMQDVWLQSARVQCTHPGWRRLVGYAAVMDSWERIFESTFEMSLDLTGVEISVVGNLAWVVCTENITSRTYDGVSRAQVEATNLFERHGGEWRMVHHHGSPVVSAPGSEEPSPHLQ